jgi:hypothetical protein
MARDGVWLRPDWNGMLGMIEGHLADEFAGFAWRVARIPAMETDCRLMLTCGDESETVDIDVGFMPTKEAVAAELREKLHATAHKLVGAHMDAEIARIAA